MRLILMSRQNWMDSSVLYCMMYETDEIGLSPREIQSVLRRYIKDGSPPHPIPSSSPPKSSASKTSAIRSFLSHLDTSTTRKPERQLSTINRHGGMAPKHLQRHSISSCFEKLSSAPYGNVSCLKSPTVYCCLVVLTR